MRFLTRSECADWARTRGYPLSDDGQLPLSDPGAYGGFASVAFYPPEDSGRKVGLARLLVSSLGAAPEYLVWVTEWSVWPSSEHLPLFDRIREALGERRPLIEAPGCLAGPNEVDDIQSQLLVSLLFIWDCFVFNGVDAVFVSHDEVGWYMSRDEVKVTRVRKQLEGLGGAGSA